MNFLQYLDPQFLIATLGLFGIFAIVFAESGLFFGFFFPGDSLLFTAGLLASQGHFDIFVLWVGTTLCAIAGDSVGYAFGKRVGLRLLTKKDSLIFRKEHIHRTEQFYEKYGKKTIVLARFVPIVRTFAPILAGIGHMPYRAFLAYNILGGILWTASLLSLGFILGAAVPSIDRYLLPIVIGIIVVSFLPVLFEHWKSQRTTKPQSPSDKV